MQNLVDLLDGLPDSASRARVLRWAVAREEAAADAGKPTVVAAAATPPAPIGPQMSDLGVDDLEDLFDNDSPAFVQRSGLRRAK